MSSAMTRFQTIPFSRGIDADMEEIRRPGAGGSRPRQGRPADAFGQTGRARTTFPGSLGPRRHRQSLYGGYAVAEPGVVAAPDDAAEPGPSGSPSEQIRWVQFTLNGALGSNLPTDGIMSAGLRAALRTFQGQQGLPTSGFVGPDTIAALQRSGGQRPDAAAEGAEFEFLGEFETSAEKKAREDARSASVEPAREVAERALVTSKPSSIEATVNNLGNKPQRGLYRLTHPNGRFYTGMSIDLGPRIKAHAWCLSHLGKSVKPWRVTLYLMPPPATEASIREVEWAVNRYHQLNLNLKRLNKVNELELLELGLM